MDLYCIASTFNSFYKVNFKGIFWYRNLCS